MDPVDGPYYIFYDRRQDDTHSAFVCDLPETFSNLLIDLAEMGSLLRYTFWTRLDRHNLKQPSRRPYIYGYWLYTIYWPIAKRHAGPPRVQFSRRLSSHDWHAAA